jgi:NADPH-dependent 2,4-dienoyl-CoA reductase/sulfur reductase-like enzyme
MNQQFKGYPFEAKRYPASLPPFKGGVDPKRRPVVVVGGGPVGYCAALGLANYGVPVVLLEYLYFGGGTGIGVFQSWLRWLQWIFLVYSLV